MVTKTLMKGMNMRKIFLLAVFVFLIGCKEKQLSNKERMNTLETEWYENQYKNVQMKIDALPEEQFKKFREVLSVRLAMDNEISKLCDTMNILYGDIARFKMTYK